MSVEPEFEYAHREVDNVVVQDLTGWTGETEGMGAVESEWVRIASQPHVTAALTEFSAEMKLGRETQEHLAREWTANAEKANIDKVAFVSEGIKALAVSANLDIDQEIRSFNSFDEALAWARE